MIVTLSKATIIKIKYVTIISLVLAILAMIVIVFATDSTSPTYSLNGTNGTTAGSAVKHYANWTDETALDSYIFSFDNGTGTFVNDSSAKFSYSVGGIAGNTRSDTG
jgi:hypothetical protein